MIEFRKDLSAPGLYQALRQQMAQVPDHRNFKEDGITLVDALMSGTAVFALKNPSLLAFDQGKNIQKS